MFGIFFANSSQITTLSDGVGGTVAATTLTSIQTCAFSVRLSSAQTINHNVYTKINFNSEDYDTDDAISNGTFTCPSGKAGKYVFTTNFYAAVDNGTLEEQQLSIRKNGSDVATTAVDFRNNDDGSDNGMILTQTLDLSVGDYIEVYVVIVATNPAGRSGQAYVYFTGHKLII